MRIEPSEKATMMTPLAEWLRPYHDAYVEAYGRMADRWHLVQINRLRELDAEYGGRALEAWKRYLRLNGIQYFSTRHFVATFDIWDRAPVSKNEAISRAWGAGLATLDDKSIPGGGFQSEADFKRWLDQQFGKQSEMK